ncbi:hypothetical protein U8527_05535 [Kordia algicida OT-1]|uniref:hypothetical protein n=1 Tax=Kordia algicida TaxID=221066 RepID=UPI0012FA5E7B|nr:hypothetical protein [Kordia algicida]
MGKEIANCLDHHQLNLVPKYESHDLKHVLLDYKMTAEGEIRMQAFMLGNGNYSIPSFAILLFGTLLLPDLWKKFYADFQKGRKTIPISRWSIEDYAHRNLNELRVELNTSTRASTSLFNLQHITKIVAFTAIIAGIFGMLFCLPFLFSPNMTDLVGAGFPFVGGAILTIGGLLALTNLAQAEKKQFNSFS